MRTIFTTNSTLFFKARAKRPYLSHAGRGGTTIIYEENAVLRSGSAVGLAVGRQQIRKIWKD